MKATVADRGQVTIPKPLRDSLGITPRTVLDFREENGLLIVEKTAQEDPLSKIYGMLRLDKGTDEIMNELRGDP
jgi:antitoxin PrlF